MKRSRVFFLLVTLSALGSFPALPLAAQEETVHHDISVTISPAEHLVAGNDAITLPPSFLAGKTGISFLIHKGLKPACSTAGVELVEETQEKKTEKEEIPPHLERFILKTGDGGGLPEKITIAFEGVIDHPVRNSAEEYARSFSVTPGIISEEGVFLASSSGWYPGLVDGRLVTFDLEVVLPEAFDAVSQGCRTKHEKGGGKTTVRWSCSHPQDNIYLTAGPYTEYKRSLGRITAYAFLRTPDEGLASKYLAATAKYIEMYTGLIGPYPYKKFALVENFWETGYGMPSFTLLGPQVIRFPFIINSSYPHEILHNWWGNGVFVKPGSGNWCEGLTAYLADHLIKEQQGKGAEHRRSVLQRYTDYVRSGKDFPLADFRSRHNAVTEAVGYGKCLMLFHMLRLRIGDDLFRKGLREFYRKNLFRYAAFGDIEKTFSSVSGQDLKSFFTQWVDKTGAPWLGIWDGAAYPAPKGKGYHVDIVFDQRQEKLFDIRVPLAIYVEGKKEALLFNIDTKFKRSHAGMEVPGKPLRLELDPRFDLFRRLSRGEIPPSIGRAFGDDKVLIVLPSAAGKEMKAAWKDLAAAWSKGSERITVTADDALESLPPDASVWVFGRENRFCPVTEEAITLHDAKIRDKSVRIGKNVYPLSGHAVVLAMDNRRNRDHVVCWLGAGIPSCLPGLARKLPHYGKYSYLAFEGDEPVNVAKGQWPALDNPMARNFAKGGAPGSALPRWTPLVAPPAVFTPEALLKHASFLAADRLKGRGLGTPELDEAAKYIADSFKASGLAPAGESGSFFQSWTEEKGPGDRPCKVKNVLGKIAGTEPGLPAVVVGAHYDHLGLGWPDVRHGNEGKIHNGADDNASGVSVLLELARVLGREFKPKRDVFFVAFTGEEAGLRGSRHFVKALGPTPSRRVFAMINIDSVGRLEGRKIQVLGTGSAKEWIPIVMGVGYATGIEAGTVSKDPGGGDQVTFIGAGIPAVHIFAGAHPDYHAPTDDVDKLDPGGMVQAAKIAREMITYLADRLDPLHVTIEGAAKSEASPGPAKGPARRAALGTMPDFSFQGEGVRIDAVMPGSAAEEAGLRKGDVITGLDDHEVKDLASFAALLKTCSPGDEVVVHFLRDGAESSVEARLKER